MKPRCSFTFGLSLLCLAGAALAQTAPLGSPSWAPSAEKPVGWRGDWTGRFPGATPPTEWSRRVKGITTQIMYQADKPAGQEPGKDARQLEYFTLKDWVVAGPFSTDDPAAGIDKDFIGGEAAVQPAKGAKAGDVAWKPLRVGMDTQSRHEHNEGTCGHANVDFVGAFGQPDELASSKISENFVNKVGYAHTYIYSSADAKARMQFVWAGVAAKVWLNGQPVVLDPKNNKTLDVSLVRGWNRLLMKVSCGKGTVPEGQNPWVSKWRIAAYLMPVLPVSYETKNIAWMTPVTGRSMSQPIVVGDRLFLGANISDLMCIDKKSGKVLWIRSNTPLDAMSAEQRAGLGNIAGLVQKLNAMNDEVAAAINSVISPQGMDSNQQAALDKILKTKTDLERQIHSGLAAIDRGKYPAMYENEVSSSNSTPVSDGTYVYWLCGGGMKGPGAYVIACFDLDGKRIWSFHEALGAQEHGMHTTPVLMDGKLICGANTTLLALDAKTGKEAWRQSTKSDWTNTFSSNSPVPARIGQTNVVLCRTSVHQVSDGKQVGSTGINIWGDITPIVENGVLLNPCQQQGFNKPLAFLGVRLAMGGKPEVVVRSQDAPLPFRGMGGMVYTIASPLCVGNIVYSIDSSGGLAATDVAAQAPLFRQWLDGYDRYNRFVYGLCASPTLGGKLVYITDDAGYTHIIEPGKTLKELPPNVIENIHLSSRGGNPCQQESFYTSPWFEGKRMYLRGEEYLYCIEAK